MPGCKLLCEATRARICRILHHTTAHYVHDRTALALAPGRYPG